MPGQSSMTIEGLSLAGAHVDIHVSDQTCWVGGLPQDVMWVRGP